MFSWQGFDRFWLILNFGTGSVAYFKKKVIWKMQFLKYTI